MENTAIYSEKPLLLKHFHWFLIRVHLGARFVPSLRTVWIGPILSWVPGLELGREIEDRGGGALAEIVSSALRMREGNPPWKKAFSVLQRRKGR
jgi:hypothetical protein